MRRYLKLYFEMNEAAILFFCALEPPKVIIGATGFCALVTVLENNHAVENFFLHHPCLTFEILSR